MHPLDQVLSRDMMQTAVWAFRIADEKMQERLKSPTAHPADKEAAELLRDDLQALIGKFEHVLTLDAKGRPRAKVAETDQDIFDAIGLALISGKGA